MTASRSLGSATAHLLLAGLLGLGCATETGEAGDPGAVDPISGAGGAPNDDPWGLGPAGAGGGELGGAAGEAGAAGAGVGGEAGAAGAGAGAGQGGSGPSTGGAPNGSGGTAPNGSGGAASNGSGGAAACPAGAAPTGINLRFDLATLNCGASGVCDPNSDKCFCAPEFDALNSLSHHILSLGTDAHKAKVWAAGNQQSVYVNDLNTNIAAGGAARANAALTKAQADFPCGVPTWFVVNEISAGLWPSSASYRQFVVDFAQTLSAKGKKVIIAAPFAKPGANATSWTALQKFAFIGVENYLSGAKVNANGNSVGWCQAQYQASVDAYGKLGVPKSRLFLFEHFGNTASDVDWGRGGASASGWTNAIKARGQAIANVAFPGFISYGWAANQMGASNAERLSFIKTYTAAALP